ncbi:MAG: AAA family ATPase [Oscillospiraceae bacterium]
MAFICTVTSGKGGVGKSSVASMLGFALAENNKNVLILEMDSGLRGLDVMMPETKEVVYDMGDVLRLRCKPAQAINIVKTSRGNLHYMAASGDREFKIEEKSLETLLSGLGDCYDFLILDCSAGLCGCFDVAVAVSTLSVIVTCLDTVSVRDAAAASAVIGDKEKKLIINRFRFSQLGGDVKNLDEAVDIIHAGLLGVIPFDKKINGAKISLDSIAFEEVRDIAQRLLGEHIPLNIKRLSKV